MTFQGFSHARVGRTGLGNMLFSWARAVVFAHRTGCGMLAPQWTQPKIGPLLRRETDLRFYTDVFDTRGYVRGVRRWSALLAGRRLDGEALTRRLDEGVDPGSFPRGVAVFEGYEGWFREDLPHYREVVRERFLGMLSSRVREEVAGFREPLEIAVHVRRGDFAMLAPDEEFGGRANAGESETYFVRVIGELRRVLGEETPVTVFSNAKPGELRELPTLPGVRLVPPVHAAATDLVLMSRAKVLVASSVSSFSAWASYLGGMPTVWHRPWRRVLTPGREDLAIEVGPDGRLDEAAIRALRGVDQARA